LIAVAAALLGWTLPMPAQTSKRPSVPPVAMVFAVLCAFGCGVSGPVVARESVNTTARKLNELKPQVDQLCAVDPGERCLHARTTYEATGVAVETAQNAIEIWNATKEGAAEVVAAAAKAAADLKEAINALVSE
jgi:hypothetical protein